MTKLDDKKDTDNKILEEVVQIIKEKFGESSIMKLGEVKRVNVDVIPTGSISLDISLGVGGVPKGRIIEIFGPESSGKTTLALHICAEAQKRRGKVAFVDVEHALDPEYAKRIGVEINDILISQPDSAEQALGIVETLVKSGAVAVVVVDSVAALTPQKEIEGEIGDQHVALQARLMSQALRKLTSIAANSGTTIIFINQIRMKIGVMFGNPETTPGGKALKFYASLRIEVRRIAQIKKGDQIVGNRVKAKIVKNKVAAPFQVAEFDIMYNEGISREGDIINTAVKFGVITKSGASYIYDGKRLGQGIDKVKLLFKEDSNIVKEIIKKIWETAKV